MANRVTKSSLFSESRQNVVDLINSNVNDPVTSSAEYRKWIYSREPDVKASDFGGYPFIVVEGSDVDVLMEGSSADGKKKFVDWSIETKIYASDRGYGNINGKGLIHIDAISDSIFNVFLDSTNKQTLSDNGMKFSEPETEDVDDEILNNELVFTRTLKLNFSIRMQVSS